MTWCPDHPARFAQLSQMYDIVWATTWEHHANRTIGPLLGLPALPVVEFRDRGRGDTRKLPDVSRYAGDRALAWVDDHLYDDADRWAAGREAPTLLIRPTSTLGLSDDHFEQLVAFASEIDLAR